MFSVPLTSLNASLTDDPVCALFCPFKQRKPSNPMVKNINKCFLLNKDLQTASGYILLTRKEC